MAKRVQRGSKIGMDVKMMILKRLAYRAHLQGKKQFDDRVLKDIVSSTIISDSKDYWRIVKEELLQDGLLRLTGSMLAFSHLSFQEYLAAKDMVGDPQAQTFVICARGVFGRGGLVERGATVFHRALGQSIGDGGFLSTIAPASTAPTAAAPRPADAHDPATPPPEPPRLLLPDSSVESDLAPAPPLSLAAPCNGTS